MMQGRPRVARIASEMSAFASAITEGGAMPLPAGAPAAAQGLSPTWPGRPLLLYHGGEVTSLMDDALSGGDTGAEDAADQ
jgi:hypothetical protein